ncbi:MAG: secondary thiamine-phosphate synthase enzyme YjbQ [Candidatus Firestonebacteria bacterium]
MSVYSGQIYFKTKGNTDIVDITGSVESKVKESSLTIGIVSVFVPGATGALTTIEFEPGLVADLKAFFEQAIPEKGLYNHNLTHSDANGHSHIRASVIGPSITIPVIGKKLKLGVWQQIIFVDFDNRPRERELIVQIIGD